MNTDPSEDHAEHSFTRRLVEALPKNDRRGNRVLAWLCLVLTVGLLVVGLWPLNFSPRNNVAWLPDRNGLRFPGGETQARYSAGGLAFTPEPLRPPRRGGARTGALSIELWLKPSLEPAGGLYRIVAFTGDGRTETLLVAQWKAHFIVQVLQRGKAGRRRYREIGLDHFLNAGQARFITITSDRNGTDLYLDGQPAKRFAGVSLVPAPETIVGQRMLVGNSPEGAAAWPGEIYGLAIHDQPLSAQQVEERHRWWTAPGRGNGAEREGLVALYDFSARSGPSIQDGSGSSNPLLIPTTIRFERKPLSGFRSSGRHVGDSLINILGFVPYGFCLALWFGRARRWTRGRALLIAVVVGALVSFAIELVQVWLPVRDSSLRDLVCNTGGALLGGLIAGGRRFQPGNAAATYAKT